jgi:hypothetical protein
MQNGDQDYQVSGRQTMSNPPGMPGPPPLGLNIDKCIIGHSLHENVNLSQNLNKLIQDCIICIIMLVIDQSRIHRRPPGAFSRLPNDKKGKALGTRLVVLEASS